MKKDTGLIIAIDFDGTCVFPAYPKVGSDIGAVPVLKRLVKNGHKLVLNTMRSGKELDEAVQWFKDNEIPLYGVNKTPGQDKWTSSPKVYADIYIDDAALGAPITYAEFMSTKPYINWKYIEDLFVKCNVISI